MTPTRYRHPLMIIAAVIAVLSLAAVGTVMALAFAGSVAPAWVTYTALYGLPVACLLMLFLVLDSVAGRRRAGKPVVALKLGDTALGRAATLAHSSHLAGERRIYEAVFEADGWARRTAQTFIDGHVRC